MTTIKDMIRDYGLGMYTLGSMEGNTPDDVKEEMLNDLIAEIKEQLAMQFE